MKVPDLLNILIICFIFRCEILTESCHRFLDLTGPLQIGGLPMLPDSTSFQVKSRDFIGCIADLYIDYKLLDLNRFVNTVNNCIISDNI